MAFSFNRGHLVIFENDKWIYYDTKEPIDKNRPCKKCNRAPTKEGHDACLGTLEGVINACCGHGINSGYIMKEDGTIIEEDVFERAGKQIEEYNRLLGIEIVK